ncbi:MAG: SEL1-like repeat protein [Geminicoccaceae bacterium]|nr:SEL1-like repeat protein [Geminicoccaceae bacterium]
MRFLRLCLLLVALSTASPAWAGNRVAVLVGNDAYGFAPLDNPIQDVRLMAEVLRELDFDVVLVEDLKQGAIPGLLKSMTARMAGAEVGLFYYAGHALQHDGVNLLLPVDLEPTGLKAVVDGSLSILGVIDAMAGAKVKVGLVLLDSCRDNPFVKVDPSLRAGLASVDDAPNELLVGYATSAGKVAYDGQGGANSPYTTALASALEQPGWDIYEMFRFVRRQVREATGGLQIPWLSGSLETALVLHPAGDAPTGPAKGGAAAPDGLTVGWVLWQFLRDSRSPDDFRLYVAHFPKSPFVEEADTRRVALEVAPPTLQVASRGAGADFQPLPAPKEDGEAVLATTGDRFPPEIIRRWPARLPAVPGGLGEQVDDCDLLAADPDDPARVAPGVRGGLVSIRSAVRACALALARVPENPRFLFQFARALDEARRYDWAKVFYERAAKGGYGAAIVSLGYLYKTGHGVKKDEAEAARLYEEAALLGNPRARTNLGVFFIDGKGVAQSTEDGLAWLRLAAAHGWPNALTALGDVYRRGKAVPADADAALELYRASADLGQTDAMTNIGRAYMDGKGVAKDPKAAVSWLERATAVGNEFAPLYLARAALDGKGTAKDPKRALQLLTLAAERGYDDARLDLGDLYAEGTGTARNPEEAWFQYRLAEAGGAKKAKDRLAALAPSIDPGAKAAAEARAEDWLRLNGS